LGVYKNKGYWAFAASCWGLMRVAACSQDSPGRAPFSISDCFRPKIIFSLGLAAALGFAGCFSENEDNSKRKTGLKKQQQNAF
jgi:hypothetical protein